MGDLHDHFIISQVQLQLLPQIENFICYYDAQFEVEVEFEPKMWLV